MTEYISREAAKMRIFEYGVKHRDNICIASACENLERQINSIPAADVREVTRGKWIVETHQTYFEVRCSECGAKSVAEVMPHDTISFANFCPNCGADMREEHDGR